MSTNDQGDKPISEKKPARKPRAKKITAKVEAAKPEAETTKPAAAKKRTTRKPRAAGETKPAATRKPRAKRTTAPKVEPVAEAFVAPEQDFTFEADSTTSAAEDKWARVQSAGESAIKAAVTVAENALGFLDDSHARIAMVGRSRGWYSMVDAYDKAHDAVMPTLRSLVLTSAEVSQAALARATEFARKQSDKGKLW
jgi:hypothetical protein